MAQSLSNFDAVLKTAYGPAIKEQLNNDKAILQRFDRSTDTYNYQGKNFTFPTHRSRNEGVGSRASNGTLPTAGQQGFASAVFPRKYTYGTIQIDGATMKASQSDKAAFARALSTEMKGLLTDLKNEQDRMLFNDGLGTLATCAAGSNSTTFTVDSVRNLRVGQKIDVLLASSGAVNSVGCSSATIATITASTLTITISGTTLAAYGSISSSYGVYVASSYGLEPYGIRAIIAATDTITDGLAGLAVASYPEWVSKVTAVDAALTQLALQTMIDNVEDAGNGSPSLIVTTKGGLRAYGDLMAGQHLFTNMTKIDGAIDTPTFDKKPIVADKYCPSGYWYFIDESNMVHLVLTDWEWGDDDGSVLKWVSGSDAVTAYLRKYDNVGCWSRNSHGVLTGVTEA